MGLMDTEAVHDKRKDAPWLCLVTSRLEDNVLIDVQTYDKYA